MKFMKYGLLLSMGLSLTVLTSCSTFVSGTHQTLAVDSVPFEGANCTLTNNKGAWKVTTPGTVVVHRSYGDMVVDCYKKYHKKAKLVVSSKTKGMLFGNAVFGGLLGGAVDAGDGAAYDYPNRIVVPMR
jgi:hypothetical protein